MVVYTQSNWSTRWRASIHTVEFISAIYLFGFFFSFVRWLQYLQATPLRSSVMFPLICPQIRPIQKRQLKCNASDSMWIFFCQHQRKKWRYGTANVFSSAPNSFKSMLLLLWEFFFLKRGKPSVWVWQPPVGWHPLPSSHDTVLLRFLPVAACSASFLSQSFLTSLSQFSLPFLLKKSLLPVSSRRHHKQLFKKILNHPLSTLDDSRAIV